MEYIDGKTVDRFAADANLNIKERLCLFRQVCAAIHYAHQNLIVHRDIKPVNVLVTKEGVPKLLDFGIAKLLDPNALGQTIRVDPARGAFDDAGVRQSRANQRRAITTATDVYGLGVLLYELLTGKRPFRIENLTPADI